MSRTTDILMMRRAIDLSRHGLGTVSPNPMVGAVVTLDDGTVIGEGWHRRCGEGHAEVNAIASVKDPSLLAGATIYVTLEPCSHYGKTPPCARLIIDKGLKRVVVGCLDPAPWVSGRGVAMLREAGIDVVTGVLEEECRAINPSFMTAHTLGRPWVTLKWAQSADGFIDRERHHDEHPTIFSTPLSSMEVHRLRSLHDAIMVGSGTAVADNPTLTTRLWPGHNARPVVVDRSRRLDLASLAMAKPDRTVTMLAEETPAEMLATLRADGVTSVLIEGGAKLLQSFIDAGLYDFVRVETSPISLNSGVAAPTLPLSPTATRLIDGNRVDLYGRVPWWA